MKEALEGGRPADQQLHASFVKMALESLAPVEPAEIVKTIVPEINQPKNLTKNDPPAALDENVGRWGRGASLG